MKNNTLTIRGYRSESILWMPSMIVSGKVILTLSYILKGYNQACIHTMVKLSFMRTSMTSMLPKYKFDFSDHILFDFLAIFKPVDYTPLLCTLFVSWGNLMSLATPSQSPYSFCFKGPLKLTCPRLSFLSSLFLTFSPCSFIHAKNVQSIFIQLIPYSYLQVWTVPWTDKYFPYHLSLDLWDISDSFLFLNIFINSLVYLVRLSKLYPIFTHFSPSIPTILFQIT